jgi:hypothetical protein
MNPFDPHHQQPNGSGQFDQYGQPVPPQQPQPAFHTIDPHAATYAAPTYQQAQPAPQPQDMFAAKQPYADLSGADRNPLHPVPVVRVLSPVGVEYVFLTFTLLIGASALVSALLVLINGEAGFGSLAFPAATLIATVPVFAAIFLHLKKMELQNPQLRLDASKRRSTQATQIISFIVSLFTVIGFFAATLASFGGSLDTPLWKAALDALCVLVVAGGILFYYWRDEHSNKG